MRSTQPNGWRWPQPNTAVGVLRRDYVKESGMVYAVMIQRGKSKADDLADAVTKGRMEPASVYVVGITDADAFASVLLGETIELDSDLDANLAMKIKYSEAIGTEDSVHSLAELIALAKKRCAEIDANGGTRRVLLRRPR